MNVLYNLCPKCWSKKKIRGNASKTKRLTKSFNLVKCGACKEKEQCATDIQAHATDAANEQKQAKDTSNDTKAAGE